MVIQSNSKAAGTYRHKQQCHGMIGHDRKRYTWLQVMFHMWKWPEEEEAHFLSSKKLTPTNTAAVSATVPMTAPAAWEHTCQLVVTS